MHSASSLPSFVRVSWWSCTATEKQAATATAEPPLHAPVDAHTVPSRPESDDTLQKHEVSGWRSVTGGVPARQTAMRAAHSGRGTSAHARAPFLPLRTAHSRCFHTHASLSAGSSTPLPSLTLAVRGTFVHAPSYGGGVEILRSQLLGVGADGRIAFLAPHSTETEADMRAQFALPPEGINVLPETQFFIPG